ncbi:MAG: trigger factor [Opitutales bacterium]
MNIAVENISDTRKLLVVTVPAADMATEEKSVLGEIARQARLPGFRPGKAPTEMVRKRYAKEIDEELHRKVAGRAYEQAVKESQVNVFTVVNMEGPPFKRGEDAVVKFTVDVVAEFALPEYKGLPVQVAGSEVTDAEVEAAIKEICEQRAEYAVVERPAAAGDFVKLNYTGTLNGQTVAELAPEKPILGTQNGTWEEAGSAQAPGVRAIIDGIIGLKAGDKQDVTQAFAADFEVAALAGQTVSYALEVLEVREKRAAALDAALLKSLQCESVEQLRQRVREDLKSRKEQQAKAASREQVVKALTGAVEFPLPESAIENETQAVLRDYMERQMRQGVPEAEFEKNKDELFAGARQAATGRVKLTLMLLKIAEKESIKVDNEDLHKRIMQEAMMARQKPEQIVKRLQEDRQLLAQLQRAILHAKTLDFVVEQAKVSSLSAA